MTYYARGRAMLVAFLLVVVLASSTSSPSFAGNSNVWWGTSDPINCSNCGAIVAATAWTVASGNGAPYEVGIVAASTCPNWSQEQASSYTFNGNWIESAEVVVQSQTCNSAFHLAWGNP